MPSGGVAVDSIVAGQRGNGGQSSEPLRWQISACSASRAAPMVDRVALPISRQRAQNPMGNRARVIRSVAVDSIVADRGADPSDSVEEVCQRLIVFCFGLEGPPVNGPGIRGIQTSGSNVAAVLLIVSHFNQGCDVGVEGGHRVGSFGML